MKVREIDWVDPLRAFAPLARMPYAVLFHAGAAASDARWSALAAFPESVLEKRSDAVARDGASVGARGFDALSALHAERRKRADDSGAPAFFATGLAGFIGYEMGAEVEPSAAGPPSPFALPDMAFGAYDASVVFDRLAKKAFLCSRSDAAAERLMDAAAAEPPCAPRAPAFSALSSNFSEEAYRAAAADIIGAIRDGAFFQANIARHLAARSGPDAEAFDVFRAVASSDAQYASYLNYEGASIVCASPERFFSLTPQADGMRILAEPIKGTRRRAGAGDDAAAAKALREDPKERAENVMIADLMRSDLSRICRDDSIREEAICALVSTQTVHHLVSRLGGVLRDGLNAADAMKALFPCGSVTGAPKVEAMRAIAMTERIGRGPYCGAIGYIDDRGGADFAVAIRTAVVTRDAAGTRAVFPVGGGVTLRSDPKAEYDETAHKAQGLLRALGVSERRP